MIGTLWSWLTRHWRKLLPMAVVIVLGVIGGFTDWFGQGVQDSVRATAAELLTLVKPMAAKLILALFLLNLAWFLYSPLIAAVQKVLDSTAASPRAKDLTVKLLKFGFWGATVFMIFTFAAADFLGQFVVGFGVLGAALTLAMQGAANDFICGLLIQFCRKINDGESVVVEGLGVQGKVVNVGYLSTIIDAVNGVVHVPNREIWARAVRVMKPEPSKLILPPGFKRENKS